MTDTSWIVPLPKTPKPLSIKHEISGIIKLIEMVILHVKRSDANQFLYETFTGILIEDLVKELVQINNWRLKIDRAAQALEDLASKGPIKPEALRGLTGLDDYIKAEDLTVINGLKEMPPKTGVREVQDEHHFRTGWLVSEELCRHMLEECMKAK